MPITTGFHSIWGCPFFVRSPLITLIIFFVKSTHGTVQCWPEVTTEMSPFLGWKLPQEQSGDSLCRWTLLPSQMLWKCWWINTIKPQTNVVVHHSSVRTKVFLQCATGAVFNQQHLLGLHKEQSSHKVRTSRFLSLVPFSSQMARLIPVSQEALSAAIFCGLVGSWFLGDTISTKFLMCGWSCSSNWWTHDLLNGLVARAIPF